MTINGPFEALRKEIERIHGIGNGKVAQSMRHAVQQVTMAMITRGWNLRVSPYGKSWRPGKLGGGDLNRSGNMRRALRAENRVNGFACTLKVKAIDGAFYGGVHQYGKTIKAKGIKTARYKVFYPSGMVIRQLMRGVYNKTGAKPLVWRGPTGKWSKAWKVRVPARPMLPRKGDLPTNWDKEIRVAIALYLNTSERSRFR